MKVSDILMGGIETWYHGSTSKISKFEYTDKEDALHQEGPGIYLTSSKADARIYGEHIHEVQVKIVKSRMMPEKRIIKPEFIRFLISNAPGDALSDWDENPSKALNKAVNVIMSSYGPNEYREAMEAVWGDFYRGHEREWLRRMSGAGVGWDGFILSRAENVRHFICFNPEILKVISVSSYNEAVDELKIALLSKKKNLQAADTAAKYKLIDVMMTNISKVHGITGQQLHDMWVSKYKEIPDTWIARQT